MKLALVLVVVCTACRSSALMGHTAGAVTPTHAGPADSGWAIQSAFGAGLGTGNFGHGMHAGFRRAGSTQELALGMHMYRIFPFRGRNGGGAFLRAGVNLIEWDRVAADDGLGVLGPSLELGIGSRLGVCFVASVSRDLRFNDPDDTFFGVSGGVCSVMNSLR